MRGPLLLLALLTLSVAAAENDRLVLTDGRQFAGQFVSLDNQVVRFAFGSSLQEMPRSQVKALYQAGQQVLPEPAPPEPAAPVVVEHTTVVERPVYVPSYLERFSGWTIGYSIAYGIGYGIGYGRQHHCHSGWHVGWSTGWYVPIPWCR